ncbi:hypothetical protein Kpho02_01010 [Kitasatospora phosalacinea]|uniref:Uncharacterized protein n=1 Tax=Kitasatospora phosalacinea TaxID=2065 RepID=A0A9W6V021_9ACTN|nr:hypothetical protein Kpho02_01010 [Kitasatospora phosalacinea]
MRLRPGVVAPVKELRDEYGGGIDDERYPPGPAAPDGAGVRRAVGFPGGRPS